MAKESRTSRRIPILNVFPITEETRKVILEDDRISSFILNESFSAIREAYLNKKSVATIFSLNGKSTFYGIDRKDWTNALNKCIEFNIKNDNFELCAEIDSFLKNLDKKKNVKVPRSNKTNC